MTFDDSEVGKCPVCGGELVERLLRKIEWLECEYCGYRVKA